MILGELSTRLIKLSTSLCTSAAAWQVRDVHITILSTSVSDPLFVQNEPIIRVVSWNERFFRNQSLKEDVRGRNTGRTGKIL